MKNRSLIRFWAATIIFVSGYIPLFLILIIKDMNSAFIFKNPGLSYSLIITCIVSGLFLYYVIKNLEADGFPIEITSVKHKSSEIVNYTIPYMISFFAFDLTKTQDLIVFIIFFVLLCILSIRSQSIFLNPILAIVGYGLYECTYKENDIVKDGVIISNEDLIKNNSYKIKKLSMYISIISEYPKEK